MGKNVVLLNFDKSEKKYICGGKSYDITGLLAIDDFSIPVVNIPIMSDKRWNELARQQKKVYND